MVREAHEKCLAHSVALVVLHNQSVPGKIYSHALTGCVSIFCQEHSRPIYLIRELTNDQLPEASKSAKMVIDIQY